MIRFIHIPKTGGTSVVSWLEHSGIHFKLGRYSNKKGYTKTHSTALYWKERYPHKERAMFSIVRNPYTRLVSYYRFIKKVETDFILSWEEFVDKKYNNFLIHSPWQTQMYYIANLNNKILVNKILYFENLELGLQKYFKVNIPLSQKNVTNYNNLDYIEEYYKNNALLSIVKEHFATDFANLNY